jgi:hypothetical protein
MSHPHTKSRIVAFVAPQSAFWRASGPDRRGWFRSHRSLTLELLHPVEEQASGGEDMKNLPTKVNGQSGPERF